MNKARILVIEDEKDIADLVVLHLKRQGFYTQVASDGEAGIQRVETSNPDLIVLDWMLPGISGLDVARQIRKLSGDVKHTPILMLTARSHTNDIIEGLNNGADDFLVKPFELPVLLARVSALLRRKAISSGSAEKQLGIDGLGINLESYEVCCKKEPIHLTLSEFRLLAALMKGRGTVLTRDRLIDQVQGDDVSVIERTIDTHIFGLRKKLGKCSDLIETVRGVGYRVRAE